MAEKHKINIKIGNHLAKSHISVNGQEVPATNIKIELGSDNPRPKVTLDLIPGEIEFAGELEVVPTPEAAAILTAAIEEGKKVFGHRAETIAKPIVFDTDHTYVVEVANHASEVDREKLKEIFKRLGVQVELIPKGMVVQIVERKLDPKSEKTRG